MRDLRSLTIKYAARDEQVRATLDQILARVADRRIKPTTANVIAFPTNNGATDELACDLAALLKAHL
jgi:hypothetical protein